MSDRVNLTATITGSAVDAKPDPADEFPFSADMTVTFTNKNVKQSDLVAVQGALIDSGLSFAQKINALAQAKAAPKA